MSKFIFDDIPFELHGSVVDGVYSIINTDTGEAKEYTDEQETIVAYFGKLENAMLKRGFLPSDFVEPVPDEALMPTEEAPQEASLAGREQSIIDFERRFGELKTHAFVAQQIQTHSNAELHAYFALCDIYKAYNNKVLDTDNATRLVKQVKTNLYNEEKDRKQLHDLLFRASDDIKRSSEALRFVMTNVGTATLEELLINCIKYICCLNGDTVTPQVLERRLSE